LVHLGYVAFDTETEEGYIPNYEVRQIFESTLKATGWDEVIQAGISYEKKGEDKKHSCVIERVEHNN
jgi:hypothetical protein